MLELLSGLFLWLTMITFANCQPLDGGFGSGLSSDMRLLDEDSLDLFNKTLASKSTSTMRNDVGNTRTSKTLVIPPPPTLAKHPVQPILSDNIEGPLYPTSRGFITPPLPREHHNPFADKPTLRGSNSDNVVSNRRPQIPIPPPVPIYKSDKDRIPIKRPDLIAQSDNRKKTINTPSMQKLPEGLNYSEPSSSPSSTTHRTNDTYDIVIPNVHNISRVSVLRILNNDKKYEVGNNKPPRFEQTEQESSKALKTYLKEDAKNTNGLPSSKSSSSYSAVANNGGVGTISTTSSSSLPASTFKQQMAASSSSSSFSSSEAVVYASNSNNGDGVETDANANPDAVFTEQQQVTQAKSADFNSAIKSVQESTETNSMPDHPEPRARYILGIAWDIHVYLIAVLFAVLAGVSAFSLFRMRVLKWLLPYGYFFAVHVLLMTIGAVRSMYLFYDAYNIGKSFSEPVSRLMLNVVFPFLVCVFSLMFVFILKIVDLKSDVYYARKSNVLVLLVVVYALLSVSVDLYADFTPYSSGLILLSQCLYVFLCVVLGVTYIIFYKYANRSSLRKQNSVYGTAFTDPLRPSLAHAIRVMLATSLLSLLMAAIQVIGIFCIYDPFNKDQPQPHPWLWWAFQLSVRVIEVSICFLVFWAAVQPLRGQDEKETQSHNSASGFPLFPWGVNGTPRGSDHGGNAADDIYPAICSTNQAIHNYTLRTGKQVYEDIFQYCNSSAPGSGPHLQPQPLPLPPPSSHHHAHHRGSASGAGGGGGGGGTLVTPVPTHLLHHTADRRSLKIHRHHPPPPPLQQQQQPPPPPNSHIIGDLVDPASLLHRHAAGTYTMYAADRRPPQPSPSMLIDEKGIVRFRSIADAELHTATAAAAAAPTPVDDTFSRLHLNHPSNENYCTS